MRIYFSKIKDDDAYVISSVITQNGETELVFPTEHNGLPVVGMWRGALDNTSITSVVISESVTNISDYMFSGRTGLTSITIGNGVKSIDDWAFVGCTGLTSITIPDSVINIGNNAFLYCARLTSITIGNGVKNIDNFAFDGCTNLTSITIGNGVKRIGSYAFRYCTKLTSITIPEGIMDIDEGAFYGCRSLTSIAIPSSVQSVGMGAFEGCTCLANVTFAENSQCLSIGEYAFLNCISLKKCGKFKATNAELVCRNYEFKIGEWSDKKDAVLCHSGYHYCLNAFDIFNYYHGKIGEDIRIFEVETEGDSSQHHNDSKRVCERIKLTREIKSFAELLN